MLCCLILQPPFRRRQAVFRVRSSDPTFMDARLCKQRREFLVAQQGLALDSLRFLLGCLQLLAEFAAKRPCNRLPGPCLDLHLGPSAAESVLSFSAKSFTCRCQWIQRMKLQVLKVEFETGNGHGITQGAARATIQKLHCHEPRGQLRVSMRNGFAVGRR